MKVHLKQIPAQGLHLEGEEDCPIHELESEGIRCAGPVRYDIKNSLTRSGSPHSPCTWNSADRRLSISPHSYAKTFC